VADLAAVALAAQVRGPEVWVLARRVQVRPLHEPAGLVQRVLPQVLVPGVRVQRVLPRRLVPVDSVAPARPAREVPRLAQPAGRAREPAALPLHLRSLLSS
jgi:hypothetical protein